MIDTLRQELSRRAEAGVDTANLFERLSVSAETKNRSWGAESEQLGEIVHAPTSRIVEDCRINAYEHVISRKTDPKHTFKPNRTPKAHHVDELSADTLRQKPSPSNAAVVSQSPGRTLQQQPPNEGSKLKYRYDESLENAVQPLKHKQTVCIDISEAIALQRQQKKHLEVRVSFALSYFMHASLLQELRIREASEKLAQRFSASHGKTEFSADADLTRLVGAKSSEKMFQTVLQVS
jgi:hypothetical protein